MCYQHSCNQEGCNTGKDNNQHCGHNGIDIHVCIATNLHICFSIQAVTLQGNENLNSAPYLVVERATSSSPRQISLLQFQSLPPGCHVTSAVMYLTGFENSGPRTVRVYQVYTIVYREAISLVGLCLCS